MSNKKKTDLEEEETSGTMQPRPDDGCAVGVREGGAKDDGPNRSVRA